MTAPSKVALDFAGLLRGTLSFADDEFVSLGYEDADGVFHTAVMRPTDAVAAIAKLPHSADVFFGVCPVTGPARKNAGRGTEADVTRLSGLWCDLDIKPGGCPNLDVARAITANLGILLGTRPSAYVYSGHGLHAYWAIADGHIVGGDTGWERALVRRWGRLVAAVAAELDVGVDSVYDLARVLRVPGSYNNKSRTNGEEPPLVTAGLEPGSPLTVDEVDTRLSRVGIDEVDDDRAAAEEAVSPPADWQWAATTCWYAGAMIDGWATDTPAKGRHPWLVSSHIRLACAHRLGCITEADYARGSRGLDERFDWLTRNTEPRREPKRYEVSGQKHSAREYGITKAAAKTDEQARVELGGHTHPTANGAAPPRDEHGDFWKATEVLTRLRDWAWSRRVGAWATLGPALVRVVVVVPPSVQIYPYIGGNAALNLYVGLVGPSGRGKGGPERAARDALATAPVYVTGPGSGEGLNHMFAHYDKKANATVFDRREVYFSVPEVDTLASLGSRNGSTLLSQLCKAWSGESLTFAYADPVKRLVIPDYSYRLCMVVGVQPARAGALLDAADSGVPQRFLWLPTDDPGMPDERPAQPAQLNRTGISTRWPKEPTVLELPAKAAALIDRNQVLKMRGQSADADLDGHLGLCRIKAAVALALLHDSREVTDLHWELSGEVMAVSQETRARVEEQIVARAMEDVRRRGRHEGIRAVESETVQTDAATKRVAGGITRKLQRHGGEAARSAVRRDMAKRDRDYFEEALTRLIAAGQVEVVCGERGDLLRLADS